MTLVDITVSKSTSAPQYSIVYVAAATIENPGFFKDAESSFAWLICDGDGKELLWGPSGLHQTRVTGDHTKALFPALLAALCSVPDGSYVEVRSDSEHFVNLLNGSAEARRNNCYRRKNKRPLADADHLRKLDDMAEVRLITLSAQFTRNDGEDRYMSRVKSWASEVTRNLNSDASSWNL